MISATVIEKCNSNRENYIYRPFQAPIFFKHPIRTKIPFLSTLYIQYATSDSDNLST